MALTPEQAGENDRAITLLRKRLGEVQGRMRRARTDTNLSGVYACLDDGLSIAEFDLVRNALPKVSGEDMNDLRTEHDALVKAIDCLKARM